MARRGGGEVLGRRAKTLMGWEPAVDWEAAVSRTVSWFSERLAVDSIVAAS
jgi:nucleoside-diphosphate-sugar epimerase